MSAARNAMLEARYYHKQESTYEEVCARTAGTWSTTSEQQQALYEMMVDGLALPNTPAIANAGRPAGYQMGSACFVLGIEDSVAGIMGTVADAAQVQKAGGGTGFDFSAIRPKGSTISSTNREAPGPVHFMKQYSMNADYISQGGLRNQANMGILRCDHPDVMDFIGAKRSNGDIANFNISVAATDDFMYRTGVEGGLSNQYPGGFNEHDVWRAIVDCAWECADPGLFFIDCANAKRLHPELYCATNPCGEVPLLDREACVLGSVNLGQHVYWQGDALLVDWEKLGRTTRLMTRMLDNIIDLQDYPLEEIKRTHQRYRKIGVGCMGWADLLTLMSMRYGSSASLALAEEVQLFMRITEYDESRRMADELGPYPGYHQNPDKMPFRRNLCCQVIAPTGSIARLAGCSFGIEPHFFAEYTSNIVGGSFRERHPLADHESFVTAEEVTPDEHIRMQSAFQGFVDQAVSKTCNLPADATRDDIDRIYRLAWDLGCKGTTVYREGCKDKGVIERVDDCANGKCSL